MKITLEQVIEKFDGKIEQVVRNNAYVTKDIEDVKQNIYMSMVKRGYLKKYSQDRGELSTYIYTFVRNHCRRMRRDFYLQKNKYKQNTISFEYVDKNINGLKMLGYFKSTDVVLKEIEWNEFVEKVLKEVENKEFYTISPKSNNINLKIVINLILSGYNTKEISRKTGISWTAIEKKLVKLSQRPWMVQYSNTLSRD